MYTAKVHFTKTVEHDNYEHGVTGTSWIVSMDSFYIVNFTDVDSLKQNLVNWMTQRFNIDTEKALEYIDNECQSDIFAYDQNENADDNYIVLSSENPNGYLCRYEFYIDEVYNVVNKMEVL